MTTKTHMFTAHEAAMAYVLSAERMFCRDKHFLEDNPSCVPIFVSLLFQALEISIKHAGLESCLFSESEIRSRQMRKGHGIKEIVGLAMKKLGGDPYDPIILAMTYSNRSDNSAQIIKEMICGPKLERTRESYASRRLGYGQTAEGDFVIIEPIKDWIAAVKETVANLPSAIDILSQWKKSSSSSRHFAIWFKERSGS